MSKIQTQLLITMLDDGSITVQGPIGNKLLCYGLLGVARDILEAHVEKPQSNLIIPRPGSVPT